MKRRLLLALPALLLTAACGGLADMLDDSPTMRVEVKVATFVGVWAGFESATRYDLRADGTFTVTGLPVSQVDKAVYERDGRVGPFQGRGHWKLAPMPWHTPNVTPETSRQALLTFDELLDTDKTRVEQRGTITLNAEMPIHGPPGALVLTTDDDWFRWLPEGK